MKKKIAFGVAVVVLLLAAVYFFYPETLFNLATRADRSYSGLIKKEVQVDDHHIAYLEGGKGETLLLLHGFGANKDNWTRFAKYLTRDYHLVIPDLAGFGESSKSLQENYDIENQLKRLDRFTELLKLDRFHIAGNSMGGMMAAIYGTQHPQKVLTFALLAPHGLISEQKSEVFKQMEKGINPLLIHNTDDFEKLLALAFVKPPPLPAPFKKVLAAQAMANSDFNEKIFNDLIKEHSSLEPFLPLIDAPVLIIWGDADKILDVSGASVLEKNLKDHQTVIMKDTGHFPMLEKPQEAALIYESFLKSKKAK